MTDNRTTELLDGLRSVGNLHEFAELFGFNWEDDSDWTWHDVAVKMADELEQAIAATLGSDASAVRLAERFRSIADEMRSVGASSMTPHELLACYANDVDKVADSLMFAATLGSEPDMIEITQTYDAGFRNGVQAVFQQLDALKNYEELQDFIGEYWGAGEGYDEP